VIESYPDIGRITSILSIGLANCRSSHSVPTSKSTKFPPELDLLNQEMTLNNSTCRVVASSQCSDDFQAKAIRDGWIFLAWKTQHRHWICQLTNQGRVRGQTFNKCKFTRICTLWRKQGQLIVSIVPVSNLVKLSNCRDV